MQLYEAQTFAKCGSVAAGRAARPSPGLEGIGPTAAELVAARERQLVQQFGASAIEMSELLGKVISAMGTPPIRRGVIAIAIPPQVEAVSPPPGLETWSLGGATLKHAEAPHILDTMSTRDAGTRDFTETFSDRDSEAGGVTPASERTLMVRNIPKEYNEEMLLCQWPPSLGYDFFYLPRNKRGQASLGYAFLNFGSEEKAEAFRARWHKHRLPHFEAPKRLNVSLAEVQGFEANVRELKQKPGARMKVRSFQPAIFRAGRRLTLDDV